MGNDFSTKRNYLIFIAAFYVTLKLTAFIITYKVTDFKIFSACFSVLIIPIWFLTGDIIAEIYGYKVAKQLLLIVLVCQLIMILLCYISSKTISPPNFFYQGKIFEDMFSTLMRGVITNTIGIIVGGFANAKIIIVLKSIFNGRHFVLRCLIANIIGECIFTIIAYSSGFFETSNFEIVVKLMLSSYIIKLIITPLLIVPAAMISNWLSHLESSPNVAQPFGVSKWLNDPNSIISLQENASGESYFSKYKIEFPIIHELGKFSKDYNNINLRFGELQKGLFTGLHNPQNPQLLICLTGNIRIITNNGSSKDFTVGDIVYFNDINGSGHSINVLSNCKIVLIDLEKTNEC